MASSQVVVVGFLLIAFVHGQYDLQSDISSNQDSYQGSYGNNQPKDSEQDLQAANFSAGEQRFKMIEYQIQQKIEKYHDETVDQEKIIRVNDYLEKGTSRQRRSWKKKVKKTIKKGWKGIKKVLEALVTITPPPPKPY